MGNTLRYVMSGALEFSVGRYSPKVVLRIKVRKIIHLYSFLFMPILNFFKSLNQFVGLIRIIYQLQEWQIPEREKCWIVAIECHLLMEPQKKCISWCWDVGSMNLKIDPILMKYIQVLIYYTLGKFFFIFRLLN